MKNFLLSLVMLLPAGIYAQTPASELSIAAAKALPAVVQVQTYVSDSLWNRYPDLAKKGVKPAISGSGFLMGSASGVLVSTNGQVITNAHVVEGGDSLVVILPDRRSFRAVLAGTDDATDLALLTIQGTGLPFLEFGDPNLLSIGDPVLAIGNPMELNSTVTAGILSARFRNVEDTFNISLVNSYLQTDAASNEGMSGSALVDRNGKLIGINAAILSPTGAFSGYAFAIPSGIVKKAWQELARNGRVQHAGLDMTFSDMDAVRAARLHAKNANGVLIESLVADGAADRSGLRRDDILLRFEQQPLYNSAHLRELLAQRSPGDRVTLNIERKGVELIMSALLSPADTGPAAVRNKREKDSPVLRTSGH